MHRQVRSDSDTGYSDNKMNISADMVLTMIGLILALLQLASAVMTVFQNRNLLKTLRHAGLVSVLSICIHLKTRPNISQRGHKAESIYALPAPTPPALNAPMFQGSKCKYFETPLFDAPGSHHVIHQPTNYDLSRLKVRTLFSTVSWTGITRLRGTRLRLISITF